MSTTQKGKAQEPEQKQEQHHQGEETMNLEDFTKPVPLHHSPNDHLVPQIVEDDWELSIPSGFMSSLPNNPEWPVTERLIYNFTQAECDRWAEVKQAVHQQQEYLSQLKDAPRTCLVTGANGLIGSRLVEMLVQRGAKRVVAISRQEFGDKDDFGGIVSYCVGKMENIEFMTPLVQDIGAIFVCTDLSPFAHSKHVYERANHLDLVALLTLAEESNVEKFIYLTTPSTRISTEHPALSNVTEFQLSIPPVTEFFNEYFRTKALGERAVQEHNSDRMMTVCIAPHLPYGPNLKLEIGGDHLLLPQLLEAAQKGDLRVLGNGQNKIDITHVDNACHALILAAAKLTTFETAPAGNFYLVTDDLPHHFWGLVDDLVVRGGLESLKTRIKAPSSVIKVGAFLSKALFPTTTLNPYTAATTQKQRTFNIDAAKADLGYVPAVFWKDEWIKISQILLDQQHLPCYNTRYYYEGTQFEGFSNEVAKAEATQGREDRRLAHEERVRQQQLEEEEEEGQANGFKQEEQQAVVEQPKKDEKKISPFQSIAARFRLGNKDKKETTGPVVVAGADDEQGKKDDDEEEEVVDIESASDVEPPQQPQQPHQQQEPTPVVKPEEVPEPIEVPVVVPVVQQEEVAPIIDEEQVFQQEAAEEEGQQPETVEQDDVQESEEQDIQQTASTGKKGRKGKKH